MKLLRRTGRDHLRYTALVLAAAGVLLFVVLTRIIAEETDEKLLVNIARIEERLAQNEAVASLPPVMEVVELDGVLERVDVLKDTLLFDPEEDDEEVFREASAVRTIEGRSYHITLRQVVLEPHDYLGSIGIALAIAFALLLIVLVVIQRRTARRIWDPFYRDLEAIKGFSLKDQQAIALTTSDVDEFNDLNRVVSTLMEKVHADHRMLKEFSENAAHEMRTPVAVIQARLDDAAQDPGLSKEQAAAIGAAQAAVQRLSQLNSALLLLTRIDNLQFAERVPINAAEVIDDVLEQLQGHIAERGIHITLHTDRSVVSEGEPTLFRILVLNLLKNAVGHNIANGSVVVSLTGHILHIRNTGLPMSGDPQRMFDRFARASKEKGSIGLGLSIAQRICAAHGWSIDYTTKENEHSVVVRFQLQDRSSITA